MQKRLRAALVAVALLAGPAAAFLPAAARMIVAPAAVAYAQPDASGGTAVINVETRLSLLENRLARVENDVSKLSNVPTSLARIEEKITALGERTGGLSGRWDSVTTGLVLALLGGGVGYLFNKAKQPHGPQ